MPMAPVLVIWPALLCLAGGQGYYDWMTPEEERRRCGHGTFDYGMDSCVCHDGWKRAGLTDFFDFLAGKCTQYQCSSDQQCKDRLGDYASCPVEGWNCYCGWERAFSGSSSIDFGLGSGYQTWGEEGAACQGPLYTLSFWATGYTFWLCSELWKLILVMMLALSVFGQTHVRCQCHDPSMFRVLRLVFRVQWQCNGMCTAPPGNINDLRYTWWTLYYDLAWSIYVLDVGIWLYCFLLVLLGTFLVGWAILIWLMVIVAAICTMIAMALGALCSASDGGNCDCNCDCNCGFCDCNMGDCRCDGCCPGTSTGYVYDRGPFYYYGGGPSGNSDDCGCDQLGRCFLCYPLARLFQLFPRMPSNMWGGVFGYVYLKTHPLCTEVYQGGSRFIDFFGFRGNDNQSVRDNRDWRNAVAGFLRVNEAGQAIPPRQSQMTRPEPWPSLPAVVTDAVAVGGMRIRGRRIISSDFPFDPDADNCRNSTFEDYKMRECWICCDSKEEPNWDLWVQCGHLFCSRCSEQMLRRGMPCPLCRRVSYTVKRGKPFREYTPPDPPA